MRRWLCGAAKAVLVAALALLVPLVNLIVDPAGIFSSGNQSSIEVQAASIILSGHSAENLVNYDERLVKRICLYKNGQVDAIVLGSSRAALITKDMAEEDSFFNYAVTGSTAKELIGMYGVYWTEGYRAKRVILAVDPYFVNGTFDTNRFEHVLSDGYFHYLNERMGIPAKDIGTSWEVNAKYLRDGGKMSLFDYPLRSQIELFSISYFQSSISELLKGRQDIKLDVTDEEWTKNASLRPDGSYCYPQSVREASEQQIREIAETQLIMVGPDEARILGSERVDPNDPIRVILYGFLKSLVEDGVRVDIVIPPINPILYDFMTQYNRYKTVLESEQWYYRIAQELGIRITGSFNPHNYQAGIMDFYDGYHYRAERVADLMQNLNRQK